MRTAFSDTGPRDASRSSLEGSAGPAFHSDVLPDLGRHDEQLAALMSPAQREATQAEPHTSAAHQLAAAAVIESAAAASNALPASLLELRTPSQLCCWANGCYPLPPVIPVFQQHDRDTTSTKIAIQMPENAHERLQEVAGVDGKRVQLRAIAVQSTKVLLDEEAEQPPSGKALWISLPASDLRTGVVYMYLLAKAGGASAAPQQLTLFASLPMLALPPAIGVELEDLFGAMIQEMRSKEEAGCSSSSCSSEGRGQNGSDGESCRDSDGRGSVGSGARGRLQRSPSAPVVSIHRTTQEAASIVGDCRWRDRIQGLSIRSEPDLRGSASSNTSFSLPPHSQLPSSGGLVPNCSLPDDVAETLGTQLASLATLEIPRSSCTVFRSAASAYNLALSLLSSRSPLVRSVATSVHDTTFVHGVSSYAGLIAASKRMHVYASSPTLVAATFSTHFGPLSADLGYVLETAERCVAFRAQNMGAQATPAGVLNAMGVDILLLAETVGDMSHLFNNQGTILSASLLRQAAEKLEGTTSVIEKCDIMR